MAMRRPVVATDHGGPPEILSGGGGVLVPPGDAKALAAAVTSLLEDPGRRSSLADTAREQAQQGFSIDAHVESIVGIYDELLKASSAGGT
jgi:glycosyltransferase involved in cell wall biosynthesis